MVLLGVTRDVIKYLVTAAAYLGTLWVAVIVSVFGLISFVGPHSAPLAKSLEPVVYLIAGALMLVVPIAAAVFVWRSWSKKQ